MYRYLFILLLVGFSGKKENDSAWIRINLLGFQPSGVKVAVWCSKEELGISNWELVDAVSKKIVYSSKSGNAFGAYGPFKQTYRLNTQTEIWLVVRLATAANDNDLYRLSKNYSIQAERNLAIFSDSTINPSCP